MNDCLVTRYKDVSDDETLITLGNTKLHVVNTQPRPEDGFVVVVKNPGNFMRIFNSPVTFSDDTQRFDFTEGNLDSHQAGISLNAGEFDIEIPLYDLNTLTFNPTYGSGDGFVGNLSALRHAQGVHSLTLPYTELVGNLEDLKDQDLHYLNLYRANNIEGNIEILTPAFIRGFQYLKEKGLLNFVGFFNFGGTKFTGSLKTFLDNIAQDITDVWNIDLFIYQCYTVDVTNVTGVDVTINKTYHINFDGNGGWTVQS